MKKNKRRPKLNSNSFFSVLENSSAISVLDTKGQYIFANKKFLDIFEYSEKEIIGNSLQMLRSGYHGNSFYEDILSTIQAENIWTGNIKVRSKNGRFYWMDTSICPVKNEKNIIESYLCLQYDITAQKELLEIEENYFDIAIHDLKTPLILLKLLASNLNDKSIGILSDQQKIIVKKMQDELNRMALFIKDMLDISKLKARKIEIDMHHENISQILSNKIKDFNRISSEQRIMIRPDIPNNIVCCFSIDGIKEVLNNVLSNAIRFADKNIDVFLKRRSDYIMIGIKDDGPGIKNEDMLKLFRKFSKIGPQVQWGGYKSSGLGLSICREIIENTFNGKIWAASEFGKGTTFYCLIPLKCVACSKSEVIAA